jgi:hypothetical protein
MPAAAESALSTSGLMLELASKLLLRSGSGLVIRALFCPFLFGEDIARDGIRKCRFVVKRSSKIIRFKRFWISMQRPVPPLHLRLPYIRKARQWLGVSPVI